MLLLFLEHLVVSWPGVSEEKFSDACAGVGDCSLNDCKGDCVWNDEDDCDGPSWAAVCCALVKQASLCSTSS